MTRSPSPLWLSLVAALALSACGGGSSDSDPSPAPAPAPEPAPAPTPSPPAPAPSPVTDRIEPYDPSAGARASPVLVSTVGGLDSAASSPRLDAAHTPTLRLPALPPAPMPLTKAGATPGQLAPQALQVGQGRTVAETATAAATAALLDWQPTPDGAQVAALRFVAEGAQGLRLGLALATLPAGASLHFYGDQGTAQLDSAEWARWQATLAAPLHSPDAPHPTQPSADTKPPLYWSPDLGGAAVTLELRLPPGVAPTALQLAVPLLSHITLSSQASDALENEQTPATLAKAGSAGSCTVDLQCQPAYLEQSRSVARLRYVATNGTSYQCSGVLLNDAASSTTPYLLTAGHCLSTQAEAASLSSEWFYRSRSCNSLQEDSASRTLSGGATLLYSASDTDVALVRLNRTPPAGVVYAGSYFGKPLERTAAIASLHHSGGDFQRISLGQVNGYAQCGDDCGSSTQAQGGFYAVQWQQGVTELGSSGGALFVALGRQRYVAGQLFGGTSSCTNPSGNDYFGRLDLSYRNGLHRWLSPGS